MSRNDRSSLVGKLASLAPEGQITRLAESLGVVKRKRKKNVFALVWTLTLGFGAGRQRTLAGLHRAYEVAAGAEIAWASFYEWFGDALVDLMKQTVSMVLEQLSTGHEEPRGVFAKLPEIMAIDSMVIRLREALEKQYPGCRINHSKAAAKLHMVMTVAGATPAKIKITSERVRDEKALKIGPWVGGRLLLFDLGYYKFQLFDRIDRNKGWFVSRAKSNFNPTIVEANRSWRGCSIQVVGEKLLSLRWAAEGGKTRDRRFAGGPVLSEPECKEV